MKILAFTIVTVLVLLLVVDLWPAPPAVPATASVTSPAHAAPVRAEGVAPAAASAKTGLRTALGRAAVVSLPCPGFAELLDRLVRLGVKMEGAVARGDRAGAKAENPEAKRLLAEIARCVRAPEEKALFVLTGLMAEDESVATRIRRRVCLHFVGEGLRRRHQERDRSRLDALVSSMLSSLPQDERLARDLGLGLLADKPYLGLAHEEAVLDLAALSVEQAFLVPIATRLLLTLWQNLEREKLRTSGQLAALALLFKDDSNPARRRAALERLLLDAGGRFRELALQEVLRRGDRTLAQELALVAATSLEPKSALGVLERLTPLAGSGLMAAFMSLAARDPAALQQAYERRLADDTGPAFRAELVTGAGFEGKAKGIALARLAFDHDTDPGVRSRAMFVLTSQAGVALGEQTLAAALDDPVLGKQPPRLGRIALALENLASLEDPNVLHRIGRRLLARKLLPADRERLVAFLKSHLPAGLMPSGGK